MRWTTRYSGKGYCISFDSERRRKKTIGFPKLCFFSLVFFLVSRNAVNFSRRIHAYFILGCTKCEILFGIPNGLTERFKKIKTRQKNKSVIKLSIADWFCDFKGITRDKEDFFFNAIVSFYSAINHMSHDSSLPVVSFVWRLFVYL